MTQAETRPSLPAPVRLGAEDALPAALRRVRVIEPPRRGLHHALRRFWRHRRFVLYFGLLFMRKRYARTWLGWLWIPLRPSISMLTRILVYGGVVGISAGNVPYAIFFLATSAAWQLFYECAYWSTRSLELNRSLLRTLHVPRLTVLLAGFAPSLLDFLTYVGMIVVGLAYYLVRAHTLYLHVGYRSILVPAGLGLLALFGLGIGFLTSSVAARARDVRFGIRFVLGFLYFLTPVIYPISAIPNKWRPLAELNPLTGAVEMVKDGLFATHSLTSDSVVVTLGAVVALWLPALWLFFRRELADLETA